MVAAVGDIEDGVEVGRLTRGGEHGGSSPLQLTDLGGNIVVGRVLQPSIKITTGLQVKELAHVLAGGVLKSSRLDNGDLPGLSVSGGIAALDTLGIDLIITHKISFFLMGHGGQDRPNIWGDS